MRTIIEILLVIAFLIGGVTWWNTKSDGDAQKARAEEFERKFMRADSLSQHFGALKDSLDEVIAIEEAIREAEREQAEEEILRRAEEVDSLTRVIVRQAPEVAELVAELNEIHNAEKLQFRTIILTLKEDKVDLNTKIDARDQEIMALKEARDRAVELAAFWEKEAKPSFGLRLKKNLGLIGTTVGITSAVIYIASG